MKKILDLLIKTVGELIKGFFFLIAGIIFLIIAGAIFNYLTIGECILAVLLVLCTAAIINSRKQQGAAINEVENFLQFALTRRYNEDNLIIGSDFYEKLEDGHWLKTTTIENIENPRIPAKLIVEHIRTDANYSRTTDPISADIELNQKIISERKGHLIKIALKKTVHVSRKRGES